MNNAILVGGGLSSKNVLDLMKETNSSYEIGSSPPENKNLIWIDSGNNDQMKVWDPIKLEWKPVTGDCPYEIGTTAPMDVKKIWIDSGNFNQFKFWNGSSWIPISDDGPFTAGPSAPANRKKLWIDTNNKNLIKFFNGSSWVPTVGAWG